jgi:mRNA interferase MazF
VSARGGVYWYAFGDPRGIGPAKRRPVVVVQSQSFNNSAIGTTIVASLTSRLDAAAYPGNVFLPASATGLPKDCVARSSELSAVDRRDLDGPAGQVPPLMMRDIDAGLRLALDL